jgi:hypothetical protein
VRYAAAVYAAVALVATSAGAGELVPPPDGARLLFEATAEGTQIYTCEARGTGFAWVLKAPDARLVDKQGHAVATHFAGPTWKATDGSSVVGEAVARADAPGGKAIPWLLLKAKSHDGAGVMSNVAFIRRLATRDGLPTTAVCDAAHKGAEARSPYSAIYQFYGAATAK